MIVTLLTDFGTADFFVGAMKGAVLSVNPRAQLLDITHEIEAQDIEAGAFTLCAASETYPPGTVHIAVVDPGVGSNRRAVIVEGGGQLFVGPDNGIFGLVFERLKEFRVYHVTDRTYFRRELSSTFHGRDIFAPVAGALSRGVAPESFGQRITDFVRLPFVRPRRLEDGRLEATIIHVDRFGNCITNISPQDMTAEQRAGSLRLVAGRHEITSIRRFYAEDDEAGAPFMIWGSAGLLEISVNRDSAARLLNISRGQTVRLMSPSTVNINL